MTRRFALGSFVVMCALVAPSASALEPAKEAEGKKAFSAGVNLLNDPDGAKYDEAFPLFRKAYELLGNWKVLGNLGLAAMKLERDGDAIDAYERYLKDGGKAIEAGERTQVTRDLDTLKAQSARVHLEFSAGSRYLLDDRLASSGAKKTNKYELPGTSADFRLRQGFHRIVVHTAKDEDIAWEVDLAAGASASHKFEVTVAAPPTTASATTASSTQVTPPPPKEKSGGLSTGTWVAGGVTAALAIGAVVTGVLAHGKHSDFASINGQPGHTKDEADSLRSSGQSLALVSTVLTGAAVLGAGVTAYIALSGKREQPASSATWLGVGPTNVSFGARFLSHETFLSFGLDSRRDRWIGGFRLSRPRDL